MLEENPGAMTMVALASVGLLVGVAAIAVLVVPGLQPTLSAIPGGTTTSTAASATGGAASVRIAIIVGAASNINLKGYAPDTIAVVIGVNNTVTWTNDDTAPHTVTALDGAFDSGNLNPGQSFEFKFTTAGTYQYKCDYHSWMGGTVVVLANEG